MADDLEYTGLMALAWDPLRGDTSSWADRAFFLERIAEFGGPVLDVGCGTGRLLLDFLSLGIDIDGVEISPDMLRVLRSKATEADLDVTGRVVEGAMESMALSRRYRVIIVPSSSFQLVIDPVAANQAMARFFEHLQAGGHLIMPWIQIPFDYPNGDEDRSEQETTLPDGSTIRRALRAWYDADSGLEHTEDRYELWRDGALVTSETKRRSPATRHYPPATIEALHADAGFEDVRFVSGFTMEPALPDDRVVTTLAKRGA